MPLLWFISASKLSSHIHWLHSKYTHTHLVPAHYHTTQCVQKLGSLWACEVYEGPVPGMTRQQGVIRRHSKKQKRNCLQILPVPLQVIRSTSGGKCGTSLPSQWFWHQQYIVYCTPIPWTVRQLSASVYSVLLNFLDLHRRSSCAAEKHLTFCGITTPAL